MEYINLDFDLLYNQALTIYRQCGGDVLFPGDEKEILLRSVLFILQQERASLNAAIAQSTVRAASGEYLDVIAENAGVARQQTQPAQAILQVTVQRAASGITIAAGTQFAYNGQLVFETTRDEGTTAGSGTAVLHIPIACTQGGAAGNGLIAGTILAPIEPKAYILDSRLQTATAGGIEREDDEAFRSRIIRSTFQKNATGSRAQYKAVALSVSAAILDASPVADEAFEDGVGAVYGLRPGQVLVSLMLDDALSAQERAQVIQDAWMELNRDESRPLTDTVIVREARVRSFRLTVRYRLQDGDGENRLAAVLAAAQEYRDWQCAAIGRAFDPYRLTSLLYSAGCSRVDIDAEQSEFDGAEATYTEVDGATRITGEVTLEEIGL